MSHFFESPEVAHELGTEETIRLKRCCSRAASPTKPTYRRYGLAANQGGTYLATFRAVTTKYPHKASGEVLADLVKTTPGDEGKWFAAAKDAGLYDDALALAGRTPCDPRTLTRAARDYADKQPAFAVGAGLLALHWLVLGYGYEITSADVLDAYRSTLAAAKSLGTVAQVQERIRKLVASDAKGERFVTMDHGAREGVQLIVEEEQIDETVTVGADRVDRPVDHRRAIRVRSGPICTPHSTWICPLFAARVRLGPLLSRRR